MGASWVRENAQGSRRPGGGHPAANAGWHWTRVRLTGSDPPLPRSNGRSPFSTVGSDALAQRWAPERSNSRTSSACSCSSAKPSAVVRPMRTFTSAPASIRTRALSGCPWMEAYNSAVPRHPNRWPRRRHLASRWSPPGLLLRSALTPPRKGRSRKGVVCTWSPPAGRAQNFSGVFLLYRHEDGDSNGRGGSASRSYKKRSHNR